jgi:hypothetical protein
MNQFTLIKKAKKFLILSIFFCIAGLFITSFFPLVTYSNTEDSFEDRILNNHAMSKINSDEIIISLNHINNISILLWIGLTIGILSLFGIYLYISKYFMTASISLILSGCFIFIINIIILFFSFIFYNGVNNFEKISHASILGPFNYFFIITMVYIISSYISIKYIYIVTFQLLSEFRKIGGKNRQFMKPKENILGLSDQTSNISSRRTGEPKITDLELNVLKKAISNQKKGSINWLSTNIANLKHKKNDKEDETKIDPEFNIKNKNLKSPANIDEKNNNSGVTNTIKISKKFEQVLSNAIDKRKIVNKKPYSNKQINKNTIDKKNQYDSNLIELEEQRDNFNEKSDFNKFSIDEEKDKIGKDVTSTKLTKYKVRCPKCKNIFITEKNEKPNRVICPKCGKKGIIE